MQNPQANTQKAGGENNTNLLGNRNADKGTINMGQANNGPTPTIGNGNHGNGQPTSGVGNQGIRIIIEW